MCPKCAAEGATNFLPWLGMLGAAIFMARSYVALAVLSVRSRVRSLFSRRDARPQTDGA